MKNETHFGGGSNTFFSTNTLLLTTNIYIWSMKTVTTYLYKAPQPHRHSIGLTAKKFRNVSLSDAQLGNQALLASYFSLKPNLLISQEGHSFSKIALLHRQETIKKVFGTLPPRQDTIKKVFCALLHRQDTLKKVFGTLLPRQETIKKVFCAILPRQHSPKIVYTAFSVAPLGLLSSFLILTLHYY
jgi:hypothetical protein